MADNSNSGCGCFSLIGLILAALGVVFITLKLCGVIAWCWFLVLLPLIALAGLGVLWLCLVLGVIALTAVAAILAVINES